MEPSAVSHRRLLGPAVTFIKRLIRKATRWYVGPQILHLEARVRELLNVNAQVGHEVAHLHGHLAQLEAQRADAQAGVLAQFVELRAGHERFAALCARMERHVFARPYVNPEFIRARPAPDAPDFDYQGFEQKFRGPSKLIRDKLAYYIPLFDGCDSILDIGCGRGEFLEALRDAGRHGIGVESNPGQAAECRKKDLPVVEADLFDHLESVPDDSVGGIFCAQVIEHLGMARIDRFLKLARRKLQPGGVLIAETVNPHCLAAFQFFYLDPTHIAPLYPEVVQFVAESAGFAEVQVCFPTDSPDAYYECGEYAVVVKKATTGPQPQAS
jgi:SAM-dependent methyltransferase